MKKVFFAVVASSFILTGCKTLDVAFEEMNSIFAPMGSSTKTPVISASVNSICAEVKNNPVKAESLYAGKRLNVNGSITAINESFSPRYSVMLNVGNNVVVHAGTNDTNSVMNLSKGGKVSVTGTVKRITHSYKNCSISLENPSFI